MERDEKERLANDLHCRNHQAGMNCGRLCIKNYHLGRPYSDYEYDVLMLKMSGAVVGELNHSRKFPAAFRGSVCQVVNSRVRERERERTFIYSDTIILTADAESGNNSLCTLLLGVTF